MPKICYGPQQGENNPPYYVYLTSTADGTIACDHVLSYDTLVQAKMQATRFAFARYLVQCGLHSEYVK